LKCNMIYMRFTALANALPKARDSSQSANSSTPPEPAVGCLYGMLGARQAGASWVNADLFYICTLLSIPQPSPNPLINRPIDRSDFVQAVDGPLQLHRAAARSGRPLGAAMSKSRSPGCS
jgi:hypothetical protein